MSTSSLYKDFTREEKVDDHIKVMQSRSYNNCCNNNENRVGVGLYSRASNNGFANYTDPPPPFNAANSRAPTAPASTETCHPCSSFAHPIVNCFPKNGQKSPKRSCSSFFSCLTQFLILSLSLMTFLLILMQQVLLTDFPQNQSLVTQIWKFKNDQTDWMPSHFQTWSSEKENHENHSVVIEELPCWTTDNNHQTFRRFRLTNSLGIQVELCSLGASVTSFRLPDKFGHFADVILGFDNAQDYLSDNNPYMGATVGRVANRISKGQFSIDNDTYLLAQNDGNNHLHGGLKGFDAVNWEVTLEENSVVFAYHSHDGEEGYPGDLNVFAKYSLSPSSGDLDIEYSAMSTKKTIVNLANHMYFNLAGHDGGKDEILDHLIQINAEFYTPVDAEIIPTGEIAPVQNTAFDLRVPKKFGELIGEIVRLPRIDEVRQGFDHNFVISSTNEGQNCHNRFAARTTHPGSGRTLEVYSNQPGLHLYTGNDLPNWTEESLIGKDEAMYEQHGGFSLATGLYPDAVNQDFGLKSVLFPGQIYYHNVNYRFGIE